MSQSDDEYQSIADAIKTISIESLEETIKDALSKALRGVDLKCSISSLEITSIVPGRVNIKLAFSDELGSFLPTDNGR